MKRKKLSFLNLGTRGWDLLCPTRRYEVLLLQILQKYYVVIIIWYKQLQFNITSDFMWLPCAFSYHTMKRAFHLRHYFQKPITPVWSWVKHQTNLDWGTLYRIVCQYSSRSWRAREKLRDNHRPKEARETSQLNAMWYPELNPGKEKILMQIPVKSK